MASINGEKVKLRTITMDDLPGLWRMIYGTKNPEWKKWDAPYFPLQPEPFQYFIDSFVPALKEKPPRYLAIEIGGELKGTVFTIGNPGRHAGWNAGSASMIRGFGTGDTVRKP